VGKRNKLILGIVLGAIILFSGALFGLAKFGVIHIKYLADTATTGFWVEPTDGSNIDLLSNTRVYAYLNGSSPTAGVSATTVEQTGIDGLGNRITKNIKMMTLNSNTTYNFVVSCSAGGYSTPVQSNSNNFYGSSFFDSFKFHPVCSGGGGGGQTKYCVRGHVTDAATGSSLQTVRAFIGSASGTTDSFGNYSIGNLTYANLSSDMIGFSKDGYNSLPAQHVTNLNSQIQPGSCDNTLAAVSMIKSAPPIADTFSEIGTVKDQAGAFIDGATIQVSCLNSDQTPGISCGDGTNSWFSSSKQAAQVYYPNVPTFNYEVPGIKRYSVGYTAFPRLRLSVSKPGYFWDQNGDNLDNDTGTITYVQKPNTIYTINNSSTYLNYYNFILKRPSYSIVGVVKDSQSKTVLSGVTINGANKTNASGYYQINYLGIAEAATKTFTFHLDGYTDQTKTLQQLGINSTTISPNQTTPYSASDVLLQQPTFSITGLVKNSQTNKAIDGVTVTGGGSTDTSGRYQSSNLLISEAASKTFTFHKAGYTDQTKTLQQLGINPTTISSTQTTPYPASDVLLVMIPNVCSTVDPNFQATSATNFINSLETVNTTLYVAVNPESVNQVLKNAHTYDPAAEQKLITLLGGTTLNVRAPLNAVISYGTTHPDMPTQVKNLLTQANAANFASWVVNNRQTAIDAIAAARAYDPVLGDLVEDLFNQSTLKIGDLIAAIAKPTFLDAANETYMATPRTIKIDMTTAQYAQYLTYTAGGLKELTPSQLISMFGQKTADTALGTTGPLTKYDSASVMSGILKNHSIFSKIYSFAKKTNVRINLGSRTWEDGKMTYIMYAQPTYRNRNVGAKIGITVNIFSGRTAGNISLGYDSCSSANGDWKADFDATNNLRLTATMTRGNTTATLNATREIVTGKYSVSF